MAAVRGMPDEEDVPACVRELSDGCVRAVEKALGFRLDHHPDTIPLVDYYLSLLPNRPRATTRDPVRGLVAALTGVYFGEVVRRLFPCRWAIEPDADPIDWRLEFRHCFLTFYPVAVAWEVILRREVHDCCAAYLLDEPTRVQIAERLDALPGATLDEYYTFAQRLETLVLTVGWLSERVRQKGGRPPTIGPARYRRFLARLRTPE